MTDRCILKGRARDARVRITQVGSGTTCVARFLTFHNLLQLHLQGLDGSHRILAGLPVHPVDGELPAAHHGDVVVLHVQHLVGVLDDGAAGEAHTELKQPPPRSQRAILMQPQDFPSKQ